ncbi:hypothetical protein SERLA73DRAFT_170590 [Serpula lacrymans var. lacrymans S7.3]|uniref:Uncharacterized protein n=2 Tax=Serpula lacrymans var. lacrymans TaxID=341189 RepID=F8Q6D7_SERL3|nr:uncharacterized protein SERLADRAFT_451734 [Serpula lacrymans var. lacrymans S7.9]EGN96175.1 hypothetical protein SERLA73DRAFT_170590 [Serpula lacrymans var. lacrymans S7.3]EGO21719.1 hypothetical protein SERLADRAFT_451734 [Serpula lacrymans var. lacrymans S7.9]
MSWTSRSCEQWCCEHVSIQQRSQHWILIHILLIALWKCAGNKWNQGDLVTFAPRPRTSTRRTKGTTKDLLTVCKHFLF